MWIDFDPFKVRHRHTTGIGIEVGNDHRALIPQHIVSPAVMGPFAASIISFALIRAAEAVNDRLRSRRDHDIARSSSVSAAPTN